MSILVGLVSATAAAKNPYLAANNTWITINGTVKSVSPNSFVLDYNNGVVIVEMDDGDRDADGYKLVPGDKVRVNGVVDDDFFELTTIEANSVFVEKLGTYFFASAVDEEDYNNTSDTTVPIIVSKITVQGIVTDIDDHEFKIDNAMKTITVNVQSMPYNPLDDKGYQKIEVGDIVRASGTIDDNFFTGHELVAETVVKLID